MSPPRRYRPDVAERAGRRRTRRRSKRRGHRILIALGIAAILLVVVAVPAGGVGGAAVMCSKVDLDDLRATEIGQNSFVYAVDGSLLGAIPAERNRQPVPAKKISKWMPKATVAIEDRRFYEHSGVDVEGIARAAFKNLSEKRVVEGGSTITQQLVRNLYISRERTVERKLKEACLAIKLDRRWSKQRILTNYMNQVYYGNHAYGIEAAARTYFSVRAKALTLKQSALIAGLTQAPSTYDPIQQPERALVRRDQVLRAMFQTGAITRAQYREAVADRSLRLDPGKLYQRIREPYFFTYVYNQLVKEYGGATVRSGGLRVYTTIDRQLQIAARRAIVDTLPYKSDPASAVVSIQPSSGAIRAMVAVTPNRIKNQYNLVSQGRRQAGSTFKTFVLVAAVEQGADPDATYYTSRPFVYQANALSEPWPVKTYSNSYLGSTSVARATLSSDNTVFAQLTLDLGAEAVANAARRMGVTVPQSEVVPALGLGAISVSPLELASAYATLAAGGIRAEPMAIRKVVLPGGKVDDDAGWGKPKRKRVLADWVAHEVTEILEDNVEGGTGVGAQIGRQVAGKTGTTDNHADAWFAGYTPQLQTTVWVGYPQAQIPMENVHGISVAGGTFPADIWRRFMTVAMEGKAYLDWLQPQHSPEWRDFDTGQHSLQYIDGGYEDYDDYDYDDSSGDDSESAPAPAQPAPAPRQPPPPPTVAPPPPPPPAAPPPADPGAVTP
jgi:penicillin-binding protein 1A